MSEPRSEDGCGAGCVGVFVVILIIGAIGAAAISLTALIDPFDWMAPVGEIWEECTDDYDTEVSECDLHRRFPGFWGHAIANLAYALTAAGLLLALGGAVSRLREHRPQRFDSREAADRYATARRDIALLAALAGLLAALPIVVALA